MAEYNSLKVEELQAELTARGLGFTENDKKADLIAILEKSDADKPPVKNADPVINAGEYALTDAALTKGYKAKIANGLVIVHKTVYSKDRDHNGKQIVISAAYAEVQTGFDGKTGQPIMEDTGNVLKNISDQQLKELVYAGIIKLTPEQETAFREKFYNLKP